MVDMTNSTSKHSKKAGRVLIVGGSMAGLFAAINLRNLGWDVQIFERAESELANRGAGIATHNELYAAVRSAGIELRDEMGVHSNGRVMFDRNGSVIASCDMQQIMTSWGLIYRFLREKIPNDCYHSAKSLLNIEQTENHVTAAFDDGTSATGDWLIGADGSRSTTRTQIAPEVVAKYCGYLGWRGLIDESLLSKEVHEQVAHQLAFSMAPGGHWLGYLVAGPNDALTPGQRWYNWGWYRTADDEALRQALTDANGKHYPLGIPHTLLRDEVVTAMRDESRAHLSPQANAIIEATAQPFIQGMYDFGVNQMRYGRTFLVGDAAFTARPHVGLGVSKAADDASKLAHALSSGAQSTALANWETERLRFGKAALQWGRDLGSYIGPEPSTQEQREKAAHYLKPETLITVTASIDPNPYLEALY
jgi:2-polyprenyl-6-methoxyphenol hydroxylase-like FAD-dependent oxidoreductase